MKHLMIVHKSKGPRGPFEVEVKFFVLCDSLMHVERINLAPGQSWSRIMSLAGINIIAIDDGQQSPPRD